MDLTPTKMLPDRGDFAPGNGERQHFEIAASYLDGMQPDLFLSAGQVVQERLSPFGRSRTVTPEPRLSADIIAAAVHDMMDDKTISLDSFGLLARSHGGYRFRVTIMPGGMYARRLEISLRVLQAPD